ncbi:formylglycine-generating enzyme family protein [Roseobacter sp.]|uniref:formylglycine-generating enzyme family protein n=1 Tax=Roseobacter sp. TaxID=1907202 RepID=UPI003858E1FF
MMTSKTGCCSPARAGERRRQNDEVIVKGTGSYAGESVEVPGGTALIGTGLPQIADDGESPARHKKVKAFRMSSGTITNADFATFVSDTGYVTEAERIGWSFVFFSDVPEDQGATKGVVGTEWWRLVHGATWRAPNGAKSETPAPDHPVVQVSWNDARAYVRWCGGRLPTEVEWEHAARGGLGDVPFPWGDAEPDDHANMPCNIWQGVFPNQNTGRDGFTHTAPAHSFAPNAYGLYNMVGNIWEWTSEPFRVKSLKKRAAHKMLSMKGHKLLKGGSYLCHRSYCYRYRIAARSGNTPDSATPHQGFRVVWDAA